MASINHGSIGKKMSPSTQDGMIGTKITSQSAKVIKLEESQIFLCHTLELYGGFTGRSPEEM